jgi:hypothetical protein
VLYIRQSFQSDKKVKNAKEYSRYYLLHGEPERRRFYKRERRDRSDRRSSRRKSEEDLFADKLKQAKKNDYGDDDEDLFADRMRERSPSRRTESPVRGDERRRWRDRR